VPTQGPDDFDGTRMPIFRIATRSHASNPYLGVSTTAPVNRHNRFIRSLVDIDDNFLDEDSSEPLFRLRPYAWGVPSRGEIVRERD